MLKISIVDSPSHCCLVLEGKLIAPWTAELARACEQVTADPRSRELIIEAKNLTAISQEGENLLQRLMSDGVKFRCCGAFTKHVLNQLARRVRQTSEQAKR